MEERKQTSKSVYLLKKERMKERKKERHFKRKNVCLIAEWLRKRVHIL